MISIIICSRKETISEILSLNITKTVGVDFELIVIYNSENKYSIFEAYNIGIKKSKGDNLCFIHEDILFHTNGWGKIVAEIFEINPEYGLIGVAGSSQKSRTPSGWWDCHLKYKSVNIIQHYPNGKIVRDKLGFENKSVLNEVVVIDGVFLALRKEMNIFFDENLKGFHNYDLNIAIETRKQKYKVGVTNQILIEHTSIGNLNNEWIKSVINAHKYYGKYLPMTINSEIDNDAENFSIKKLLYNCMLIKGNKKLVLINCIKIFLKEPFSKTNVGFYKKAFIYLKTKA